MSGPLNLNYFSSTNRNERWTAYISLTRLNRPIGIFLLLWPTLWALWFAAQGMPDLKILVIFVLGTILTRSAGCAINDFFDRDIDLHVARTSKRPLATGAIKPREALFVAAVLMLLALILVLFTNRLTVQMSFVALLLAVIYPLAKRFTYLPQVFLGAAFSFAIPMAYAAQTGQVPQQAWLLFMAALLWSVAYDTMYAMADREYDIKLGLKSSAILFGKADIAIVAIIQLMVFLALILLGLGASRGVPYYGGLFMAILLVPYQLWTIRRREPQACIRAFLNNSYLGMIVFIGIVLDFHIE